MDRRGSSYTAVTNRGGANGRSTLFTRSSITSPSASSDSKRDDRDIRVPLSKQPGRLDRLKVKVNNVWLSPEIGGELNQHLITGVIVSVLALGVVLLSFVFGTRLLPAAGVLPSYGFVYNIPDISYFLICMIVATTRNPNIVRYVGTPFSYAFFFLELFSLCMNLTWFIMNVLGTLPRAATIGQTLFGTLFLVLGNFLMVALLLWNCVRLTHVSEILPERLALAGQLVLEESDRNIPLTTVDGNGRDDDADDEEDLSV